MAAFKYSEVSSRTGLRVVKFGCILNGELDMRKARISFHPLVHFARSDQTPSRLKFYSSMLLQMDRQLSVQSDKILGNIVLLNERLFKERTVQVYEGMKDVFLIAKLQTGENIEDIPEDWFPISQDECILSISPQNSFFLTRIRMVGAFHKAMQACNGKTNCVTDYISLSRQDMTQLTNMFQCIPVVNSRCQRSYNVEPSGLAVTDTIKTKTLLCQLTSVETFEDAFGYFATCKYKFSTKLDRCQTVENTPGIMMSIIDGKFEKVKMIYDPVMEQCKFYFNVVHVGPKAVEDHIKSARERYCSEQSDFLKKGNAGAPRRTRPVASKREEVISVLSNMRPYKISSKRKMLSVDVSKALSSFVQLTRQPEEQWSEELKYVADNIGKIDHICDIGDIYLYLYSTYPSYLRPDIIAKEFHVDVDLLEKPHEKNNAIVSAIRECYNSIID